MALEASALEALISEKMRAAGFKLDNQHCMTRFFIRAITEGVVDHIKSNAEVAITSGSSAGRHRVT